MLSVLLSRHISINRRDPEDFCCSCKVRREVWTGDMISKQSSDLLFLEDVQWWYSFLRVLDTNVSTWSCFSCQGPSLNSWLQVLLMLHWPQICSGELACLLYPRTGCKINIDIYNNNCFRILSKGAHRAGKPYQPHTVKWNKFLEFKTQQQCYQANSVLPWLFSFFVIPLFLVLPLLPFWNKVMHKA